MDNVDEGEDFSQVDEEEKPIYRIIFPDKIKISFVRQIFCIIPVLLLPYFIQPFKYLRHAKPLEDTSIYYYEELEAIGASIGYIIGGIMWQFLGCKFLLISATVLNLILALFAAAPFLLQLIQGPTTMYLLVYSTYALGTMAYASYIAEIADNTFRAFFMGLRQIVRMAMPEKWMRKWSFQDNIQQLYLLSFLVALIAAVLSVVVPETPFSIARLKKDPDQARRTFAWIRARDDDDEDAECKLMLEKARNIAESGVAYFIANKWSLTLTFLIGMAIAICLAVVDFDQCDLMDYVGRDYVFILDHPTDEIRLHWIAFHTSMHQDAQSHVVIGSLIYECLCFIVPRKMLYLFAFLLNVIIVIPVVQHFNYTLIEKVAFLCTVFPQLGRVQALTLFPIEMFPAFLRPVGVVAAFIMQDIMVPIRLHAHTPFYRDGGYRTAGSWTRFSYTFSLIGVPIILIFMPETMGISLYELDEIKLPFMKVPSPPKADVEDVELPEDLEDS